MKLFTFQFFVIDESSNDRVESVIGDFGGFLGVLDKGWEYGQIAWVVENFIEHPADFVLCDCAVDLDLICVWTCFAGDMLEIAELVSIKR